jgi:hypothetical protein
MSKSKRSKISSSEDSSFKDVQSQKLSLVEQKLFELQAFTYDLLIKNNPNKEGIVRSTRAFNDPLLNLEINLLRERETSLLETIDELESNARRDNKDDMIARLRNENEALREQLGEVGHQANIVRLDMKDMHIEELEDALAEAKGTIDKYKKDIDKYQKEIYELKMAKV